MCVVDNINSSGVDEWQQHKATEFDRPARFFGYDADSQVIGLRSQLVHRCSAELGYVNDIDERGSRVECCLGFAGLDQRDGVPPALHQHSLVRLLGRQVAGIADDK